ncbi:MAG: DUF4177 domain-containing protein [Gemmobacter sp.]
MQAYEYKVIPAPRRGEKARGAKTVPERFAVALTQVMNDMARDGWEYLRADTLPCEERVGLTGTATHFQNMLVFRRGLAVGAQAQTEPVAMPPAPEPEATVIVPFTPHAAEGHAPTLGPAKSPFTSARPPNGLI